MQRTAFLVLLVLVCVSVTCPVIGAVSATTVVVGDDSSSARVFDVTQFGAVGDGKHDDTPAFQSAFNALGGGAGEVHIPIGSFLITSTISVASPGMFSFLGDGPGSNVLWSFDATLFNFTAPNPVGLATIAHFTVSSTSMAKSAPSTAFQFRAGFVKSLVDHVQIIGAGGLPSGPVSQTFVFGGGFDLGAVTDTSTIRDCLLWFGAGTGVKIGRGSEVRMEGGRFIGNNRQQGSIGVHVTGNNGGVHVVSTDVISWSSGMVLDNSNGAGSNREIFLSHATLDSNGRGLAVFDNSYVSIAGCWTASSVMDNIWSHPDSDPLVVIAGGTIFNAGAISGDCSAGQCNGITINGGTFSLSGVAVRNNKGVGIWTPSDRVGGFAVTGCRITANGVGANLSGSNFTLTGNVFSGNGQNLLVQQPSSPHAIANNIGL